MCKYKDSCDSDVRFEFATKHMNILADALRKTENSSEKPNNCENEPLTCDGNCWMKKQNGEWLCEHCQREPQTEREGE